MNFAADAGPHSGRATPFLHEARHRHITMVTGRRTTYLSAETVQTNPAGSEGRLGAGACSGPGKIRAPLITVMHEYGVEITSSKTSSAIIQVAFKNDTPIPPINPIARSPSLATVP
jgi:hypothetical protein